jgi:hypothetical protein
MEESEKILEPMEAPPEPPDPNEAFDHGEEANVVPDDADESQVDDAGGPVEDGPDPEFGEPDEDEEPEAEEPADPDEPDVD